MLPLVSKVHSRAVLNPKNNWRKQELIKQGKEEEEEKEEAEEKEEEKTACTYVIVIYFPHNVVTLKSLESKPGFTCRK